jgi:hypothetical protein
VQREPAIRKLKLPVPRLPSLRTFLQQILHDAAHLVDAAVSKFIRVATMNSFRGERQHCRETTADIVYAFVIRRRLLRINFVTDGLKNVAEIPARTKPTFQTS